MTAVLVNDHGVRRVIFRAKRPIADGEEMCCEYSVLLAARFACANARRDPATHALLLLLLCTDDYGALWPERYESSPS